MLIRPATQQDRGAIWRIVEPVIRAGDTYTLPRDMSEVAAIAYWCGPDRETFVAEEGGAIVGTYYIRANQQGGGAHVANCGYITAAGLMGKGIARRMCEHSLQHTRSRGFKAMQFNFVVSIQRARRPALAEPRLRDGGPPAARVRASAAGLCRCAGDVPRAIAPGHSGALATSAFTRVFDALWRANPESSATGEAFA